MDVYSIILNIRGKEKMKKLFSLLVLLTIFSTFLTFNKASAQDACNAKVIIHYHRFDNSYENHELYTWDYEDSEASITSSANSTDSFGAIYIVNICSDAKNQIGVVLKETGTWIKDGLDVNQDGNIDNKTIDVTDLKGTSNTKQVYIIEGSNEVYYQDPLKTNYFGKPNYGNVVVIYYNPSGNDGWNDIWTWGNESTNSDGVSIPLDYSLGLNGGTDANLFRVGIINISPAATDQIGFTARKDNMWAIKDVSWDANLTANETDLNGHTYSTTGDRLLNVTDVQGAGFKFIFAINGVKTLFEDFDEFKAEAFKLEFPEASFVNTKSITVSFNQNISYDETGPDITKFMVTDQDNNIIPISEINFDSTVRSDKTFTLVLENDIEEGNTYQVTYNYDLFGEEKSVQTLATVSSNVFAEAPVITPAETEKKASYTPYIIAGIVVMLASGAGITFMYLRKR